MSDQLLKIPQIQSVDHVWASTNEVRRFPRTSCIVLRGGHKESITSALEGKRPYELPDDSNALDVRRGATALHLNSDLLTAIQYYQIDSSIPCTADVKNLAGVHSPENLGDEFFKCRFHLRPPCGVVSRFGLGIVGGLDAIVHTRPDPQLSHNFQINENLTWTKGRHTMKFGFDLRRLHMITAWYSGPEPRPMFAPW